MTKDSSITFLWNVQFRVLKKYDTKDARKNLQPSIHVKQYKIINYFSLFGLKATQNFWKVPEFIVESL